MIVVGCWRSTYPSIHFSPDEGAPKIAVGGPTCTNPSIRLSHGEGTVPQKLAVTLSKSLHKSNRSHGQTCEYSDRAGSVARGAHIRAFTCLLVKGTLKSTVVRRSHPVWTPFEAIALLISPENARKNLFATKSRKAWAGHRERRHTERDACDDSHV